MDCDQDDHKLPSMVVEVSRGKLNTVREGDRGVRKKAWKAGYLDRSSGRSVCFGRGGEVMRICTSTMYHKSRPV